MDAVTRNAIDDAIREQQVVNRNMLAVIRGLVSMIEWQHNQLVRVSDFVLRLAIATTDSEDLADAPMLPTPEELEKQAAAIAELNRLFGLEPGEPKGK